jgi:hypothetical protein
MTFLGRRGDGVELAATCRKGSPATAAGSVHLPPLPHSEGHAGFHARPRSHESRRLRPQWMAPRRTLLRFTVEGGKISGVQAVELGPRAATSRWQPRRKLSFRGAAQQFAEPSFTRGMEMGSDGREEDVPAGRG